MGTESDRTLRDLGLLIIRVVVGIVFVYHGSQKLFGAFGGHGISGMAQSLESLKVPMPQVSAVLAACAEFFGGVSLLLGLLTRLLAVPTLFTMLVAIWTVHRTAFGSQNNGMEFPLTLAAALAGLVLMGPGRISLDHLIWGSRKRAGETARVTGVERRSELTEEHAAMR